MASHESVVMPRVTLPPGSGNIESDILHLLPADVWMLHHLRSPYDLNDLQLSHSQSNLIVVDLPATNRLDIKSSFEHIGQCDAYVSICLSISYSIQVYTNL